ncbi:MAG: UDP-N-acetylmuramoyl-L-alanyl-D-glutamate--2,6-diaminopimelate ligase [Pseudomonadota bacterium]
MMMPAFPRAQTLKSLLYGLVDVPASRDVAIRSVQSDSRKVSPGDAFLALEGAMADGLDFAGEALTHGAAAVLCDRVVDDRETLALFEQSSVPLIHVPGLDRQASELAARALGRPSQSMTVTGVTGTDGKTSVSHFMAQALNALNPPAAVVGTLGNGDLRQLSRTVNTTPGAVELQQLFAEYRNEGFRHVVMEVSSHGLDQGRVSGVAFDLAMLTNLGRDHLDYHHSMAAYADAKRQLFYSRDLAAAVLNCDDDFGCMLAMELEERVPVYGYGFGPDMQPSMAARIRGGALELVDWGMRLEVSSGGQSYSLDVPLLGRFNASNVLAVIAALQALGVPLSEAVETVSNLRPVPGRMERIALPGGASAVVDYAHTPQALEQVLKALREHTGGRLICLFGCGGDRDKGKRPLMASVAERLSDALWVTDDNPRSERPESIFKDISAGLSAPEAVHQVHNRRQAIGEALSKAGPGDVVLIAGKGHETEQITGDQRQRFSDVEVVTDWCQSRSSTRLEGQR